jgi:hypothetical protein
MTQPGEDTPAAQDAPLVPGVAPLTAFPPEPGDPGHLVPDEDWERVQQDAEEQAERIRRGQPPREAVRPDGRFGTGLQLALAGTVVAPSHGANRGRPTFGVFHTMETPLRAGYAASLSRYAAGGPGVSWHYSVDPAETWGVLPDAVVGWHVGTANTRSMGLEQSGRAAMTRAEWLTDDAMAQHHRSAEVVRHARDEYGIGMYLMSDQQLRDAHAGKIVGGWATHDQCRRVIGGTTHTDPGSGWPADVVLQLAAGAVPAPVPPPAPAPVPPPAPAPTGVPKPPVPQWVLPAGHWLGNVAGPAKQHGGIPWDSAAVVAMVRCAQQHLIWRWCVAGQRTNDWRALGWDDGKWEGATDAAMALWHRKEYPGQPYPAQCWADDWKVLTR